MKVLVSREDAWKLDTSMFVVDGSWKTGYLYDRQIFFMVGVTSYCGEGASSFASLNWTPCSPEMHHVLIHLERAEYWLAQGELEHVAKANSEALHWLKLHNELYLDK
jgi:hypothetical protein